MKKKEKADGETFLQILVGVLAIFAIRSFFEHDNSKILSRKGAQILLDEKKMSDIDNQIKKMEPGNGGEIIIN